LDDLRVAGLVVGIGRVTTFTDHMIENKLLLSPESHGLLRPIANFDIIPKRPDSEKGNT